jgi:hypothetical protein
MFPVLSLPSDKQIYFFLRTKRALYNVYNKYKYHMAKPSLEVRLLINERRGTYSKGTSIERSRLGLLVYFIIFSLSDERRLSA